MRYVERSVEGVQVFVQTEVVLVEGDCHRLSLKGNSFRVHIFGIFDIYVLYLPDFVNIFHGNGRYCEINVRTHISPTSTPKTELMI